MANPLSTYLHDHLAGAKFAVELLERLRDSKEEVSLGESAARLLKEILDDRAVLEELCDKIGDSGNLLKEAGAWFAERAARLKLRLGSDVELGEFETLEVLSLGVLGKLKLWKALSAIAPTDSRLQGPDYEQLCQRAQAQHDELEAYRLAAAKPALIRSTK